MLSSFELRQFLYDYYTSVITNILGGRNRGYMLYESSSSLSRGMVEAFEASLEYLTPSGKEKAEARKIFIEKLGIKV